MALKTRALALAGALAGTTLFAAPAAAAPLSDAPTVGAAWAAFDDSRFDPASAAANWHCRWGCGWGGYRRGWRRNRVDAGDVLIGAVVIGGIAAILSADNRRDRERDVVIVERDRDFRDRDWDRDRYDDRRDDRRAAPRGTGASGLDNAVNQCLDRIERDVRVDSVENVARTGAGWQVRGSLFNGTGFQCRIGNDGRIQAIDYDGTYGAGDWGGADGPRSDGQWSDQGYAGARAALGGTVRPDMAAQQVGGAGAPVPTGLAAAAPMPAYPGGPIPGEVIPETIDGDL